MNASKRAVVFLGLSLAVSGCNRILATRIIESPTIGGKIALAVKAGKGRIDARRRVASADGVEIDLWVLKARRGGPVAARNATAVVIHPLMTSKSWFLSLGRQLADDGWDVVLPDLRAHGASGGKYVTWGAKEKHDVKTAVDSLIAEGLVGPRIYAMGASLGGCVALQYAAIEPRCAGVLAIASPTGVKDVSRMLFPLATKGWLDETIMHAGEIAGFDPSDASAIDAAGKLKCPLVLVHGRLDIIVPHSHSERIYAAASGPRELISRGLLNHTTIQVGQNAWIVRRMSALAGMKAP